MIRSRCALAVSVLAAASALACATGQGRRTRTVGSPATQGVPESELVCTVDYETGSNIPTRYCRTRAEAQADRDEALQLPFSPLQAPPPRDVPGSGKHSSPGG